MPSTLDNSFTLGGFTTTSGSQTISTPPRTTSTISTPPRTDTTMASTPPRDLNISDINIDTFLVNQQVSTGNGLGVEAPPYYDEERLENDNSVTYDDTDSSEYIPKDGYDYNYDAYGEDYGEGRKCPEGFTKVVVNCIQAPCPSECVPTNELVGGYSDDTGTGDTGTGTGDTGTGVGNGGTTGGPAPAPNPPAQAPKKITSNLSPLVVGLGLIVGLVVVFKIFKKDA